jgi:tripartite-type tricarboxylate transporter receptor subunit TctC
MPGSPIFQTIKNAGAVMALAVCGALAAAPAFAADAWPTRTVRIIVPHPAGGSVDAMARMVAGRLGDVLGKPFIVENRAGANGNIGATMTASAPPDGYTLMFTTTGPLVFNKLIYKSAAFDPAKDLAPIVKVSAIPLVVVANASIPVKNISDLVAYAKANPGKVTYASPGIGSMGHLHRRTASERPRHPDDARALHRFGSGDERCAGRQG